MRIVSLLPSATEIVFALGLGDELVGVTHECDYPPEARDLPVVTRSVHDLSGASSHQIHGLVEESMRSHTALYELDEAALAAAKPDLILTQELCRVCAVGYEQVNEVARRLEGEVTVLSLEPVSVEGILNAIQAVGAMTEAEDAALDVVEDLRERLRHVNEIVRGRRDGGFVPPRVAAIEWLDPPFACGHWVPEQVRLAGRLGAARRGRRQERGDDLGRGPRGGPGDRRPDALRLRPRADRGGVGPAAEARGLGRAAGGPREPRVRDRRLRPTSRGRARGSWTASSCSPSSFDPAAFDGMSPDGSWARVG